MTRSVTKPFRNQRLENAAEIARRYIQVVVYIRKCPELEARMALLDPPRKMKRRMSTPIRAPPRSMKRRRFSMHSSIPDITFDASISTASTNVDRTDEPAENIVQNEGKKMQY